jgi:hypothetical protein
MDDLTQEEKDLMWDGMDVHLAYLKGESEDGTSYADSIYYITEMLNGWNYISERDTTKYTAVLTNTTRLDLEAQAVINKTARDYLASTDWYITRQSETGVVVPTDVLTKREAARVSVINNA